MEKQRQGTAGGKRNGSKGSKSSGMNRGHYEETKVPQMKKVGNFLIDMDRALGQGQYGKVYLAQEIPEQVSLPKDKKDAKSYNKSNGSMGDIITKAQLQS